MDQLKNAIFAFQLVKLILQTTTHPIELTVLRIQFWSVKCMAATVLYDTQKFRAFPFLLIRPSHQAMQAIAMVRQYENKPLQNPFKRI